MPASVEVVAHSHRCPNGHAFQHNEGHAAGDVNAHICPRCGVPCPQLAYQSPVGADMTGWPKDMLYLSNGLQVPAKKIHAPKWRIYKLPGSGEWFSIDQGPQTAVIHAKKIEAKMSTSQNAPGKIPHKWFEAEGHIGIGDDGVVRFL